MLWLGGPDPAKHFGAHDTLVSLVAVLFCMVPLTMVLTDGVGDGGLPVALLWLPGLLLLMGLFMLVGRFPVKARSKTRTRYGLTDGRALIARRSGRVRSAWLAGTDIGVDRDRDGSHVTVPFHDDFELLIPGNISLENTGMDDLLSMPRCTIFWDVADPGPLLEALDEAAELTGCTLRSPSVPEQTRPWP